MKTSRLSLRILDNLLAIAVVVVLAAAAIAVPIGALVLTGRGTVSVTAVLDTPFVVEFEGGQRIHAVGDRVSVYENFPVAGAERNTITRPPDVRSSIEVPRSDKESRATVVAFVAIALAASAVALIELRRVVASAVRGEPFDERNPRRLRRIGGAVAAVPIASYVATLILSRTFEPALGFRVVPAASWTLAVIALAFVALAEPFAEAARLRELERTTI